MYNSSVKQRMFSLTRLEIESASTAMVMKMRSRWSSRSVNVELCLTERLNLLLRRLLKQPQLRWVNLTHPWPGHLEVAYRALAWWNCRVGYSIPRTFLRGCTIPYRCPYAANDRLPRSSDGPSVLGCHTRWDWDCLTRTCPIRIEAIRPHPHIQGLYKDALAHQLDSKLTDGWREELARVSRIDSASARC